MQIWIANPDQTNSIYLYKMLFNTYLFMKKHIYGPKNLFHLQFVSPVFGWTYFFMKKRISFAIEDFK